MNALSNRVKTFLSDSFKQVIDLDYFEETQTRLKISAEYYIYSKHVHIFVTKHTIT